MKHGKYFYVGIITLAVMFITGLTLVGWSLKTILYLILGFTVCAVTLIGFEFVAMTEKYKIYDHRTWFFTVPLAATAVIARFVFGVHIFLPIYIVAVMCAAAVLSYERYSVFAKKRAVIAPISVGLYSSVLMTVLWTFTMAI